jgi:hypothetical protein
MKQPIYILRDYSLMLGTFSDQIREFKFVHDTNYFILNPINRLQRLHLLIK